MSPVRKLCASLLSFLLVASTVPTTAIAEVVAEAQAEAVAVEYRINANSDDDPWTSFGAAKEAVAAAQATDAQDDVATDGVVTNEEVLVDEPEADPVETISPEDEADAAESTSQLLSAPVARIDMRIIGVEGGTLEFSAREAGEEWPEEWTSRAEDDTNPFADLKVRLTGDAQESHDVWYRVHEGGEWLPWTSNGEAAAPEGTQPVDDVQVLLLTKEESERFVESDYQTSEDAAADEVEESQDDQESVASDSQDAQEDQEAAIASDSPEDQDTVAAEPAQELPDQEAPAQDDSVTDEPVQAQTTQEQPTQTQSTKKDSTATSSSASVIKVESTSADQTTELVQPVEPAPTVSYRVRGQGYGWRKAVTNGAIAGTTDKSKRMEAIKISLPKGVDGGISYRVKVQSKGWMKTVSDGAVAGTVGKSKRMQAIKINLTGNLSKNYDVWYRVYGKAKGWHAWKKNGATARVKGSPKSIEAIQIIVVTKGSAEPSASTGVVGAKSVAGSVTYRTNLAGFGWMGWTRDGEVSGVPGASGKVVGFSATLAGLKKSELHYSAYLESSGWSKEVTGGKTVGKPTKGKRVEAIKMSLSGTAAQNFDIYYRCYVQGFGWLNWAKNGAAAGSTDLSLPMEAVQAKLVRKGDAAPSNESGRSMACMTMPTLRYRARGENYSWQKWKKSGATAGVTKKSRAMEALQAKVTDAGMSGQIQVRARVLGSGWQGWTNQGDTAGTTGQSKYIETLRFRLTGELKEYYDVWYRVYVESSGWMGWASNGAKAGTTGGSVRVRGVQIKLVRKGAAAPGSTKNAYKKIVPAKTGYQNPAGYYQVSRFNVPVPAGAKYPFNYITKSRISVNASRSDCVNAFVKRANEYLGTPYMWNYSCAPGVGVDCIGLVYQCAYATGMNMGTGTGNNDFNPWAHYITGDSGWHSHDANNFWNYGKAKHVSLSSRKKGDCISYPGHIAVYIGNNQVIEAVYGLGVVKRNMYDSGTPRGCIRLFQ